MPPSSPAYFFKFIAESWWTVVLGVMTIAATAFWGLDFDNALTWGATEWKLFGMGMIPTIGRFIAAFMLTAVTGRTLEDGFSK